MLKLVMKGGKMMSDKDERTEEISTDIVALSDSMSESLKDETANIISNIGEIGIDAALKNGIFRDVPILSTAISVFNIGKGIREYAALVKMFRFIREMNNGCANEDERKKRADYFKNDKKKRAEELKYLIIILDRYLSEERAALLAKIYLYYLDEQISWTEVQILSETIDQILLEDLSYLKLYYKTWQDMPSLAVQKNLAELREKYDRSYLNIAKSLSELDTSPMKVKMHTDRLVSAGLLEMIPQPEEKLFLSSRVYLITITGDLIVKILDGIKRKEIKEVLGKQMTIMIDYR